MVVGQQCWELCSGLLGIRSKSLSHSQDRRNEHLKSYYCRGLANLSYRKIRRWVQEVANTVLASWSETYGVKIKVQMEVNIGKKKRKYAMPMKQSDGKWETEKLHKFILKKVRNFQPRNSTEGCRMKTIRRVRGLKTSVFRSVIRRELTCAENLRTLWVEKVCSSELVITTPVSDCWNFASVPEELEIAVSGNVNVTKHSVSVGNQICFVIPASLSGVQLRVCVEVKIALSHSSGLVVEYIGSTHFGVGEDWKSWLFF